jgi:hypothetical protein
VHRIYFDTNEGDEDDRFDLGIPGSLKDIAPIADNLRDGMRVVLYMTDELEVEAILEFEPKYGHWLARADWSTIKYL